MYISQAVNSLFDTVLSASLLESQYESIPHTRSQSDASHTLFAFDTIDAQMTHLSLDYSSSHINISALNNEEFSVQNPEPNASDFISIGWSCTNGKMWSNKDQSISKKPKNQQIYSLQTFLEPEVAELPSSYTGYNANYILSPPSEPNQDTFDQISTQACAHMFSQQTSFNKFSAEPSMYATCFDSPQSLMLDPDYIVDDSQLELLIPESIDAVCDSLKNALQINSDHWETQVPGIINPVGSPKRLTPSKNTTKRYKCKLCCYRTNRSNNLLRHSQSHNRQAKYWKCNQCTKSYSSRSNLVRHTNNVHK
ncbi:C2H2-type zinc finger transcription factor [Phycomyces blakesleeanus NRRL 1555(-)]|uniref:C2H2-type zinc finger transcription factor n=1 Tax=Phycomyces blakesleeanus (strain ATCC 8743b / DSM 1359 / FGSC 10004 / NBRC 33097 / NRRL 1555) TaxID=763407 RepID=A0A162WH43_PHYB8|nr:C2H2-type zinc finger transcription factor [Phycomyces blakesleeanus NRRL 1555(-)]OAD67075.1 C2H2-type zinc finger transcription factor [Phycomyces blakesleeanus NRRL 1555(-)]|eukprot:XP_018285115.1 C2H2-type zinc finger transcription factor [Phycomyces blakesleeanus NRRL 1555(-)]